METITNIFLFYFLDCFVLFKLLPFNDSFQNDDNFIVVMLLMGALFFLIALIIGVVLGLIFLTILIGLISVGLISTSILVGLHQKSISKGFKTLFISVSILGSTIVSVLFFWFVNTIKEWWNTDISIIIGIICGIVTGYFIGLLLFIAIKKMILFIKNKHSTKNKLVDKI